MTTDQLTHRRYEWAVDIMTRAIPRAKNIMGDRSFNLAVVLYADRCGFPCMRQVVPFLLHDVRPCLFSHILNDARDMLRESDCFKTRYLRFERNMEADNFKTALYQISHTRPERLSPDDVFKIKNIMLK